MGLPMPRAGRALDEGGKTDVRCTAWGTCARNASAIALVELTAKYMIEESAKRVPQRVRAVDQSVFSPKKSLSL